MNNSKNKGTFIKVISKMFCGDLNLIKICLGAKFKYLFLILAAEYKEGTLR